MPRHALAVLRYRPLLRPEHFNGSCTSLSSSGLTFDERIHHDVRRLYQQSKLSARVQKAMNSRPSARCFLVHGRDEQSRVAEHLSQLQKRLCDREPINIKYALSSPEEPEDHVWSCWPEDGGISEGQSMLMMACHDGGSIVGMVHMGVDLTYEEKGRDFWLLIRPEMIYVRHDQRGQGFGFDLSIACSRLICDVARAVYFAVPARSRIEATIYADCESKGGEAFVAQLSGALSDFIFPMSIGIPRRSVRYEEDVSIDAGY